MPSHRAAKSAPPARKSPDPHATVAREGHGDEGQNKQHGGADRESSAPAPRRMGQRDVVLHSVTLSIDLPATAVDQSGRSMAAV